MQTAPHRQVFVSDRTVAVYINRARALVDCPHCGNSAGVLLDARLACCFGCGARFENLDVTALLPEIEAVLSFRRPVHQNWRPEESLYLAVLQNLDAGDDVPAMT